MYFECNAGGPFLSDVLWNPPIVSMFNHGLHLLQRTILQLIPVAVVMQ